MFQRKPNKERIKLVVDALRSGKFRQGTGRLASYDAKSKKVRYCCLGVACEVARANGLVLGREPHRNYINGSTHYSYGPSRQSGILPHEVMVWLGLEVGDPILTYDDDGHVESATALNDELLLSFRQIADALERTYLTETP